ncbi:MAG TPA: DUF4270 family protein [Flavobacteriales bacterium]|nr:DUF4270 domain-containing protein [Flavobacteriales bacterium]MBP8877087.1 DUF4270 domain-containing protein [Flavobacteriales bacterium]MBP9177918.1 DUF4270 domain-containing protein [Flavobacteriales bacterium]HQW99885.1 DUF4270 family protein [Flavobacteriales bacterium]
MIASSIVLVFLGCRKPDNELGTDLLPNDPVGVVVEQATLRAYTFVDPAVQTSGLTRNLVGSYLDPEFGSLQTGIVTQVRLTTNNVGQGMDTSGLSADSIVLALAFEATNTHYGNLNPQRFQVFELTEDLSIDSVYHTDDVPEVDALDLVYPHAGEITPRPFNTVTTPDGELPPQVRIRLSNALAERFLDGFGTSDLVDNTAFLQFFKGLYIKVEGSGQAPDQGGIMYLSTLSSASKLTVHYKDAQSAEPELARSYVLDINGNCVRYTVARHDRSVALTPAITNALMDTVTPASLVYVRTLGGLRTAVRFPDLAERLGSGRLVAKAELVVPIAGSFYPYYLPPTQLFLFRKGTNGEDLFVPDQLTGSTSGIGGLYASAEKEYRFNITRYVLAIANGSVPNNGVVLVAGSSGVSANRAILGGPEHPQTPMRLELTFTTY